MKTNKYVVIGGQYAKVNYGEYPTLRGAMVAASKHEEYWDNWQGWRTPRVYAIEDCALVESPYLDGPACLLPVPGAKAVAWKSDGRWSKR